MQAAPHALLWVVALTLFLESDANNGLFGGLGLEDGGPLSALNHIARALNNPVSNIVNVVTGRQQDNEAPTKKHTAFGGIYDERESKTTESGILGLGNLLSMLQKGAVKFSNATHSLTNPQVLDSLQQTMQQATALVKTGAELLPSANKQKRQLQAQQALLPPVRTRATFLRDTLVDPAGAVSALFRVLPFNLLAYPYGAAPPALGDVLRDLNLATVNSQVIYRALRTLQQVFSLPASLMRTWQGYPTRRSFASLGLLGLGEVAESFTKNDTLTGLARTSEPKTPIPTLFDSVVISSDNLAADLDTMLLLMSGGAVNPISDKLEDIHEAVDALTAAPSDAFSWLSLTTSLLDTQDALRRFDARWVLSDDQRLAVQAGINASHTLLNTIGNYSGPLSPTLFDDIATQLQLLGSNILRLNGTTLTVPRLYLQGVDITELLQKPPTEFASKFDNSDGLIYFALPATFAYLRNGFGFDIAKVMSELNAAAHANIIGAPLVNLTTLNTLSLLSPLPSFTQHVTDIHQLLDVLDDALASSTGFLNTTGLIDVILGGPEGVLAFSKENVLNRAEETAQKLLNGLMDSQVMLASLLTPFSPVVLDPSSLTNDIISQQEPQTKNQVNLSREPSGPSTALSGETPERQETQDLTSSKTTAELSNATLTNIRGRQLLDAPGAKAGVSHRLLRRPRARYLHHAAAGGEVFYNAQLRSDANTLHALINHLQQYRNISCDNDGPTALARASVRARALLGSPVRVLTEMQARQSHASPPSSDATSSSSSTPSTTTRNHDASLPIKGSDDAILESAMLCNIRRDAVQSLRHFVERIPAIATLMTQLAHATNVTTAHTVYTELIAHVETLTSTATL